MPWEPDTEIDPDAERELAEWSRNQPDPPEPEFLPVGPLVICADERSLRRYAAMESAEQYPAVVYEAERWEGE